MNEKRTGPRRSWPPSLRLFAVQDFVQVGGTVLDPLDGIRVRTVCGFNANHTQDSFLVVDEMDALSITPKAPVAFSAFPAL
jgi:hypothetical protein